MEIKGKLTYKFFKYCIVGSLTTIEGWIIVYCLTEYAHIWYMFSSVIGTPIVMISAFALNYFWTWGKNEDKEIEIVQKILRRFHK